MKKKIPNKLHIEIRPYRGSKGFACYLAGSVHEDRVRVRLGIEGIIACVESGDIEAKDIPYIVADCIMHEIIHALEDYARVEFSEDRVEDCITRYRAWQRKQKRKKK